MLAILGVGLTSLVKTLRIEWNGDPLPEGAVVAFWHSKMIAGWWLAKNDAVAIVSQSKDGQRLAELLAKWKYTLVRGSSSKGGHEALDNAIALIKCGDITNLVITPDGPRGPREVMKRGAFIAAVELGVPLIFLKILYRNATILTKSWDHFEVPYPLSKVIVTPVVIDTSDFPADDKEKQKLYLERISKQLRK